MNKYDGSNMPFSANNQQNRMHNNPSQFSVEDDLGECKNKGEKERELVKNAF